MDRVFLDANVLFSAAYRPNAGIAALWKLQEIERITSGYALEEARTNLRGADRLSRLDRLSRGVRIVAHPVVRPLPEGIVLPGKDVPILLAALDAGATHLLTGDLGDFGPLLGRLVGPLRVLTPGRYLRGR
ncbi:MAG: DNA-binding protein [Planctomycetes bacterium]|nr:DNA-binding protein [Planctomycetota bacterium]